MMPRVGATLLITLLLQLHTAVRAQQLANPGFEADVVGRYTYMTPTGWTGAGGVVQIPSASGPWGGLAAPSGAYYAGVQGSGSFLQQDVRGLTAGVPYNLNVWAAERPGYGNSESMRILVDGIPIFDSHHPPEQFVQQTAVFVASGPSAQVRFENDSPEGDNTFFVRLSLALCARLRV